MRDPLKLKAWERRLDALKVQVEQLVREARQEPPAIRWALGRVLEPIDVAIGEARGAWG